MSDAGYKNMTSKSNGFTLSESDVRVMVRLLGAVAALRGGHTEKKRILMNGLCKLVDADAWAWTLACQYEAGQPPVYVGFMHSGFTEDQFSRYLKAVEHPASGIMTAPLINEMRERQNQVTRSIEQIDSAGRFQTFEAAPLWREAEIGTLLISMRPLDARSASGIGIYRKIPAGPFLARECLIVHIMLSEVPWLHEQGWPGDRGVSVPSLSPRERLVLNLLLEGHGRKQIADHLVIAENTVSGYCKVIYRHFRVQSQAELLARFFRGDGGDRA